MIPIGWSDTEEWSYEEWSDGWQHGAGSAQDVFYAETPRDADVFTAGGVRDLATETLLAPEPPHHRVTGTVNVTGSFSGSAGVSVTGEAWYTGEEVTRRAGVTRAIETTVTDKLPTADGPTFARQPTQIVSAVGHNVTFQCKVLNIGEKEVIWMRSRDLQILSVGASVFSGDARVSVTQQDAARLDVTQQDAARLDVTQQDAARHDVTQRDRTHNLSIARLRPSDAGKYECQINTDPKRSLYFNLTVLPVMPQIEMWVTGGGAVREGSVAVLRCAARVRVESQGNNKQSRGDAGQTRGDSGQTRSDAPVTNAVKITLHWYKDGEPIDLQSEGGVSVESYGGGGGGGGGEAADSGRRAAAAWRRSVLRVRHVTSRRAGRYECRAAPHARAHAHLTVLSGWTTEVWAEGMQRDAAAAAVSASARHTAPVAPLPRGVSALVLAALLLALTVRALLDCSGGLHQLNY